MTTVDNQQERLKDGFCHYISGFVDGEGTFHIAIQQTNNVKVGYQLIPEFRISQMNDRKKLLGEIQELFGCGYIKANHAKNPKDKNLVFTVRDRKDLLTKIIPYEPLWTVSNNTLSRINSSLRILRDYMPKQWKLESRNRKSN